MVTIRLRTIVSALLILWCSHAWAADVELDANQDGKLDDIYIPSTITRDSELSAGLAGKQNALGFTPENAANKGAASGYAGLGSDGKVPTAQLPTIPSAVSQLSEDTTHRTVSDTEKSTWNGKQNALGFTPESAANKGTANGYASLGSDGLVPSSQLPPSTGTDDQTATEVPATAWGSYTGTNVQVLMQEVDTALRALVSGAALPSWMPSTGPTNGRQILQATGGCTLSAYDNQADCETNSGTWTTPTYRHTSIISGLINDTGTADDDLWSAAKITSELAGKQASLGFTPQPALGYTPENAANKGTANGYAGLGSDGKVPTAQLPTLGTTYDLPSLADAQAGTSTTPYVWSPQRVAQAIIALAPSGGAAEGYYEIDGGSSASITFTGDIDGGASL